MILSFMLTSIIIILTFMLIKSIIHRLGISMKKRELFEIRT